MSDDLVDLIVIGAGPGGYVAAIRAAQLGMKVIIIDKNAASGGTCLNVGCIPSKALLHTTHKLFEAQNHFQSYGIHAECIRADVSYMMARKNAIVDELTRGINYLFRKNNIQRFTGIATLKGPHDVLVTQSDGKEEIVSARHIILATGSVPALPVIDGLTVDEKIVLTSTGALSLEKAPKHLVVVGGGYIGLELGSVWARLGSAVTVIEYADRLLATMDRDLSAAMQTALEAQGIVFKLQRKVTKLSTEGKTVSIHSFPAHMTQDLPDITTCDAVLIAVGRRPFTKNLGLEHVGIEANEHGIIPVNHHYQTHCPSIFAIGDIIQGPMLAHKAMEEGVAVAEILAGQAGHVNYTVVPAIIYTSPEAASVGQTEETLKEKGIPYVVGKFPFSINSRSKTTGETIGFIKILSHAHTDKVLGVHCIGEQAGSIIAEAALAMEFGAASEDIARSCHAHPSVSETLKEAAWATFAKALHS